MKDFKARLEKLEADAVECDLIGNLATDADKRRMFRDLAAQYRKMAEAIRAQIKTSENTA